MAGYYILSTLYHFCVCEYVGIMPSDEPPPAWSPSPPQAIGVGFDPSSQEEVLGKFCKFEVTSYGPWSTHVILHTVLGTLPCETLSHR